jgi:hypothetical protein
MRDSDAGAPIFPRADDVTRQHFWLGRRRIGVSAFMFWFAGPIAHRGSGSFSAIAGPLVQLFALRSDARDIWPLCRTMGWR